MQLDIYNNIISQNYLQSIELENKIDGIDTKDIYVIINFYIFYILLLKYLLNSIETDDQNNKIFKFLYDNKYKYVVKTYEDDDKEKMIYEDLISKFFEMVKTSQVYLDFFINKLCGIKIIPFII